MINLFLKTLTKISISIYNNLEIIIIWAINDQS